VHLFIEMPFDALDVNVHPTKAEVRFRDQSFIHEVIRRTLGDALGRGPAPELVLQAPPAGQDLPTTLPLPASYGTTFPSRWTTSASFAPSAPTSEGSLGSASAGPAVVGAIAPTDDRESPPSIKPMIPLGQFRDTFIVAVDEDGIAIIDQHVAHERVLFERITERLTSGRLQSQRLLEPLILSLPPGGRQALLAHAEDLERLGFELAEFGGDTIRVMAYPAVLRAEDCDAALRSLSEDLEGVDRGSRVEEAIKRIAATMACHAAVKANYPLTAEKMAHILDELRRTSYSTICPHGRPVMLRLTRREVEKNFQRI
jgi:DNA mismatch repair protein MutL